MSLKQRIRDYIGTTEVLENQRTIMANIEALRAAEAAESEVLTTYIAAVEVLISKFTVPPDLQPDVDALTAMTDKIKAAIAEVPGG